MALRHLAAARETPSWRVGAQASGRPIEAIAPGRRCDLVELDGNPTSLLGLPTDRLLDA